MHIRLVLAILKASTTAAVAVFPVFFANYTVNNDLTLNLGNETVGVPVPETVLGLAIGGAEVNDRSGKFQREADPRFPHNKVYHLKSKKDLDKHPHLMDDKNNVIHFEDSRSSVYFDSEEDTWFDYQLDEPLTEPVQLQAFPFMIPVSACLDSRHGSGGSISRGFSVGLDIKNALTGSSTFSFMINVTSVAIGANLGISVGPSFSYLGSMLCTIPKGHIGQMMIQPFYVEVPRSLRRKFFYRKLRGWLQGPDVESFQSFKQIAVHKPHHVCMVDTDPSKLLCNRVVV